MIFLVLAFFLWFYSKSGTRINFQAMGLFVFGLLHDQGILFKKKNQFKIRGIYNIHEFRWILHPSAKVANPHFNWILVSVCFCNSQLLHRAAHF